MAEQRTILVVEDDPQVLGLVQRLLAAIGHRGLSAATAAEALALLRDPGRPVDLLLTDMILPDVPGDDLARMALELRPGLRVVYTSGYAGETVIHEGMPQGHGFLGKPYRLADLRRALDEAFTMPPGEPRGDGP